MKDNTKKWLATAGLAVVCAGLVFGISRTLYREPVQENLTEEKETGDTEIMADIGNTKTIQPEKKKTAAATDTEETGTEISTGTEEALVTEIGTDTGAALSNREQEIQPKPEKTEKEKPSDPPALPEDEGEGDAQTQPDDEEPKEPGTQQPAGGITPKTGDTKDGMVYVEGFGWLPDEGAGAGTYAGDMYENGNKIGIMD